MSNNIRGAPKLVDDDDRKESSQRRSREWTIKPNQQPNEKQYSGGSVASSGKHIRADDELSNLFMSDPSLSEEGDCSSDNQQSSSPSEDSRVGTEAQPLIDPIRANPPPRAAHPLPGRVATNSIPGIYSSSPGTTSLSSWDSPHPQSRQQARIYPESTAAASGPRLMGTLGSNNVATENMEPFRRNQTASANPAGTRLLNPSSNSTSASLAQQQQATEFLETLRQQSRGAVLDHGGPSSFTSFATGSPGTSSSQHNQIDSIMRLQQQQGCDNRSDHNSLEGGRDDTVIMTLSASDDEKDTLASSLNQSEQSHSYSRQPGTAEMESRLRNLKRMEEGNVTHQMATGEPTAVGPSSHSGRPQYTRRSRRPPLDPGVAEGPYHYPGMVLVSPPQQTGYMAENVSPQALAYYKDLEERRLMPNWSAENPRSSFDGMEAGDGSGRQMHYSHLGGFGSFEADPSVLSQSMNRQPAFGSYNNETSPTFMPRSPARAPQYIDPDRLQPEPTWVVVSPNAPPQYMTADGWPVVPDPTLMSRSPHLQPQYLLVPQGEMSMPFYPDEPDADHSEESSESETGENTGDDDISSNDDHMSVHQNRIWMDQNVQNLEDAEKLLENPDFRGKMQNIMRRHSVFGNVGQPQEKVDRSYFMPQTSTMDDDPKGCVTFTCPRCKTRQREFFTVANAPQQFETATSYLGLYFGLYVIASLFIFGLKEGWSALDCIYFAVITLTTAGLGDFTPTSDDAKIICSIFIYFGVACIGLLLGSYIAGMLDDMSHREATENRIKSCPTCARIKHMKEMVKQNTVANQRRYSSTRPSDTSFVSNLNAVNRGLALQRHSFSMRPSMTTPPIARVPSLSKDLPAIYEGGQKPPSQVWSKPVENHDDDHDDDHDADDHADDHDDNHDDDHDVDDHDDDHDEVSESDTSSEGSEVNDLEMAPNQFASPQMSHTSANIDQRIPSTPPDYESSQNLLGSPFTREIMGRQHHTRHMSFDTRSNTRSSVSSSGRSRQFSGDVNFWRNMSITEPAPAPVPAPAVQPPLRRESSVVDDHAVTDVASVESVDGSDEESVSEEVSTSSGESLVDKGDSGLQNARYVFLTLKQALVNSLLIIAVGSMGFYVIEGFTAVDSWYFTTSLLTTVGYGDICPVTNGGKLFATIYILVGGTILVNNMSLISMIPLELRKRRIERAVLTQFGDSLDDAALRELATGPLVQRLRLSPTRNDGLDECTREMFALAMLVRLGKVTEQDIKETFRAFRRLDVNNDGLLTSKTIIAGMIQKRRSLMQIPSQIAALTKNVSTPQGGPPPSDASSRTSSFAGVPFATGWIGRKGSFHAFSQEENSSERTSLLTDSNIYDSVSTNTGRVMR